MTIKSIAISFVLLVAFTCAPAFSQTAINRAFASTHSYLGGAIICQDFTGEADVDFALGFVRRLWVTGGLSGKALDDAVTESERRLVAQQGDRALPNQLPGNLTFDDVRLACQQQLQQERYQAEVDVLALE